MSEPSRRRIAPGGPLANALASRAFPGLPARDFFLSICSLFDHPCIVTRRRDDEVWVPGRGLGSATSAPTRRGKSALDRP